MTSRTEAGVATTDLHDECIEALAAGEPAVIELATELACQRDSYRLLTQQLLHLLHRTLQDCDRINRRLQRLNAQCRKLRERLGQL